MTVRTALIRFTILAFTPGPSCGPLNPGSTLYCWNWACCIEECDHPTADTSTMKEPVSRRCLQQLECGRGCDGLRDRKRSSFRTAMALTSNRAT